MSEAIERPARWVEDETQVAELAALVMDPAREKLVVCVTTQPALDRPYVDVDALAEQLGDRADVWVITSADDAWALSEALPPKINVYGGAVRAWQPIPEGKAPYPSDHPQWTVFQEDDAPRVIEQIVEYSKLADNPPPEFGSHATATVTAVRKAGAELTLDTGHEAFASNGHLIQHGEVYHAREILQPGQQVEVRVGPWHAQAARVSVSLRDFAPDPWQRLDEVYRVGAVIDGVITSITHYGAFVELLPGVEGLLHKSKIVDEFVEYVDDFVRPGDRVSVRLKSLDPDEHKAEVSMIDVPEGTIAEPPASVYPGGPPWLPDSPDAYAEDEPAEPAVGDDETAGLAEETRRWDPETEAYVQPDTAAEAEAVAAEIADLKAQIAELQTELAAAARERAELLARLGDEG
jgi:predicted RNA-binding protein with RPS1 domain